MTAMLLALTLATPVPKATTPPPCLYRHGRVAVYALFNIQNGVPLPRTTETYTYSRVKRTTDGELFRLTISCSDGSTPSSHYTLVTTTHTQTADEHGQVPKGTKSVPISPWWRWVKPGDTRTEPFGNDDAKYIYEGTKPTTVSAGKFDCAQIRGEMLKPISGRILGWCHTQWICVKTGISVRTMLDQPSHSTHWELVDFRSGE